MWFPSFQFAWKYGTLWKLLACNTRATEYDLIKIISAFDETSIDKV